MKIIIIGAVLVFLSIADANDKATMGKNHIPPANGATVGSEEAGSTQTQEKRHLSKKKLGKHEKATPEKSGSGDPKDDSANK